MKKMLELNPIANAINEVYFKSIHSDLESNYFPEIKHVNKWLCVSDYSFSNNKLNDVVSFSFIPHVYNMDELASFIKAVEPKDIKKSRKVNPKFISFLRKSPILNFSILIKNHRYLNFKNREVFKKSLLYSFDGLIEQFDDFSNQENIELVIHYKDLSRKMKVLKSYVQNDEKINIIKNMFIVVGIGSYLSAQIANRTNSEIFAWFSDRDAINDLADNCSLGLFHALFNEYLVNNDCRFYSTPSMSKDEKWYSEVIRIPDLFCGALADINFEDKSTTHTKFVSVFEDLLKDNVRNCFVINIDFSNKEGLMTSSRLEISSST